MPSTFAFAQLNARIIPIDRGEFYEDPLMEAFSGNGLGRVTGGGTMQSKEGEIAFCGIDLDLFDVPNGVPFVCEFLNECGAPRGSKLEYEVEGKKIEVPFGVTEGLAVYLNGTDLPPNVYQECDVNQVIEGINQRLDGRGAIMGYWQGPTETALYIYGNAADEMQKLIAPFLAEYPLCQRARVVTIT
jgi:hypothetical protein